MSWQEQITEIAEQILKDSEQHESPLCFIFRGYARELKAIVKAQQDTGFVHSVGELLPSKSGSVISNPVIEQAKKRAKDDADFAAAELRRQELGGEAMTQLQGGPDDGTFVASPPTNVPVGAKTNFGTHVYQVTEQRGLVYVGEMER